MKPQNKLALIAAFYLAHYDKTAVKSLGYPSFKAALEGMGKILGVNPNSIKKMRDKFDPLFEYGRKGWYQRGLRPSRAKVFELYSEMKGFT